MALTNTGLVKFVKGKLGVNYVYGMKGKKMTAEMFSSLKRLYPKNIKPADEAKIGTVCVDCSGLPAWYTKNVKSSQMYHDEAEKLGTIHPISSIYNAPAGVAVWRKGHIGVYIGDGKIIEARGSAFGVVETTVAERNFTHWFPFKEISYKTDYYPKYTGTSVSIVSAMASVGIKDTTLTHRKKIAVANGIVKTEEEFRGTAEQNTKLLDLLKKGKLVKAV